MGNEQGQTPTTPEPGAPAQAATPVASVEPESATFDAVYVKALRSEAASYRKKLAELEATRKLEDDAKLTEQERVNKRLAELEPLTETVKAYETVMAEMLDSRLTGLTPEAKKAVESLPASDPLSRLRWLTANESLFTRTRAPQLDGGTGGGQRKPEPVLTAEEDAIARKMGITPEAYAASKAGGKRRELSMSEVDTLREENRRLRAANTAAQR